MKNLTEFSNEEVAAILFAVEREADWARKSEDYDVREEFVDACYNLLKLFNEEYEKRGITLDIIGEEY